MKAMLGREYGSSEVLTFEDVDKPTPNDDQVLIRVHAASVNPSDWHRMTGTPAILRQMHGDPPNNPPIGTDVAGVIEAVGKDVTGFASGDQVFGGARGSFAEYVCATAKNVVQKPASVSFEQAAAVPTAGLSAIQALRDHGQIQAGQRVLVNGASGGVGTMAVQIAKAYDTHVTGVCSTRNVEMVRSIGLMMS